MTTNAGDEFHLLHPHLDNGRCLDGSGRTWQAHERPPRPTTSDSFPEFANVADVERLRAIVLSLTVAVLVLAVSVVLAAVQVIA